MLTGGTGDVSPQLWNLGALTLSAANTFTEDEIPVPVTRYNSSRTRATVMEVLKVFISMPDTDANNSAGGSVIHASVNLSTKSLNGNTPQSSSVFAFAQRANRGAFTAAGTYQATDIDPIVIDLTDGAGHGVLVATDAIFLNGSTTGFTAAATYVVKLLYRFKEVSLAEYIGIVQSQQ